MAKFLMLGKYTSDAVKGISADRTKKIIGVIESAGGKIDSMHALLGLYDLAFIVDFPGAKDVIKASVAITKATDIGFITLPAITVEEFDKMTK
ncbi:MAG: GYD domain-containing protein [Candidatus Omnitrophica bacterium]|nr:GYD domain-containing protein [Candidatus Omnitrophota bacterium]